MKILAAIMALLALIFFLPPFMSMMTSHEITGMTREAVYKSAVKVKRYLSADQGTQFDTAFRILDEIKSEEGPKAFIDAVNGLSPEEIIDLAKREVDIKIATGHPNFKQYSSWDDMIYKLTEGKRPPQSSTKTETAAPLRQSERPPRPN